MRRGVEEFYGFECCKVTMKNAVTGALREYDETTLSTMHMYHESKRVLSHEGSLTEIDDYK